MSWRDGRLRFLDQTRLPHSEQYVEAGDVRVVAEAISALRIRGAPAIGVAAAYGVVLAAKPDGVSGADLLFRRATDAARLLAATRPTAVNLFAALRRMEVMMEAGRAGEPEEFYDRLLREAEAIAQDDREACRLIGEYGAALLTGPASVMTHCNAGALATAGIGTALGIITTAAARGNILRVYAGETRPLLQGARLTAWELRRAGIPVVLFTDSAAASVLRRGDVQAVIVGADRIALNGDTANKVGTYPLAVLARTHGVPLYVAAPTSTIDPGAQDGSAIPIEERAAAEVTMIGNVSVAPEGVEVYSPAFDVTPNELVTAIVTEAGVVRAPYGETLRRLLKP